MRTFAQQQKQPQKPVSSSFARPNLAMNYRGHSLYQLQRTIGNQTVERMLQPHAKGHEVGLAGMASPRFGYDFSQVPVRSPVSGVLQTKMVINQLGRL